MKTRLFHGTRAPERVRAEGFRDSFGNPENEPWRADWGDFGRGVYLTAVRDRAACYGEVLDVEVELNESFSHFSSMEEAYNWCERLVGWPTTRGDYIDRRKASQIIRDHFRRVGMSGMVIDSYEYKMYEVVVFFEDRVTVIK